MKYKVGDKVKVKSPEWYNENKGEYGEISGEDFYFTSRMSDFCGKIVTIDKIHKADFYTIKEDEQTFMWVDNMFEEKVEETSLQGEFGLSENKINGIFFSNENYANKVELCLGNDYEIVVEGDKTFVQKKKSKYPTTYEECCGVLGMTYDYPDIKMVSIDEYHLYSSFIELIRCRDAYWKIADNWKPDWTDNYQKKYVINFYQSEIHFTHVTNAQYILAFPTEEMRDAFHKNFKEPIKKCEKLL